MKCWSRFPNVLGRRRRAGRSGGRRWVRRPRAGLARRADRVDSGSSLKASISAGASVAVATMSRSLHVSASRRALPATRRASAAGCSRSASTSARRPRAPESRRRAPAGRRRRRGERRQDLLLGLRARSPRASRRRCALGGLLQLLERWSTPSSLVDPARRLRPEPRHVHELDEPRRDQRLPLVGALISPGSTSSTIFSSIVLPIPESSSALPGVRELARPGRPSRGSPWRRCGRRARGRRPRPRARTGRPARSKASASSAFLGQRSATDAMIRGRARSLARPAHLQRAREHRADAARALGEVGATGARRTACSWSTTARPTAPASSPTGSRPSCRRRRAPPRGKEGLGRAYLAGFARGARARGRARAGDGRRLLPRSGATSRG